MTNLVNFANSFFKFKKNTYLRRKRQTTRNPPSPNHYRIKCFFHQTGRSMCCIRDKETGLRQPGELSIRTERDERDYQSDHYRIRLETTIIIITVIILRGYGYCIIIVHFPSLACCYHSERDDKIKLKNNFHRYAPLRELTIVVGRLELRKTDTIYHTKQGDFFNCKHILLFRNHLTYL